MVSLRQPSTLPIVGVVADGQTYRNLLYLLLAIPLGFAYSAAFTVGLVFGILLSIVLVGLVVLVATLLGTRLVAAFERWLANRLLGTDLAAYDDVPDDAGGGLASLKKYTDAASTWRGVGFVSLKFFVTFLAFIPVFGFAYALPLVAAPLRYPYTASFGEVNGEPVTWAITTLPEALFALPIGVVGVIVTLHVSNLIAYGARQMAAALLGDSAADDAAAHGSTDTDPTDSGSTAGAESVTVDNVSAGAASGVDSDRTTKTDRPADEAPENDAFDYAEFGEEDGSESTERDADR